MDAIMTRTNCLFQRVSLARTRLSARRLASSDSRSTPDSLTAFFESAATKTAPSRLPQARPPPARRPGIKAMFGLDNASDRDQRFIPRGNTRQQSRDLDAYNAKQAAKREEEKGLQRLTYRRWQEGDVYTPHDLTPREILQYRTPKAPTRDIFDVLGINPINEYKNPVLLAEFMTSGGRIKHPRETGLRPVNQRKIAKAIRRAQGMGLIPTVHVHPEMMRRPAPDMNARRYTWR